jgi:hypothetical protein
MSATIRAVQVFAISIERYVSDLQGNPDIRYRRAVRFA